jgi:hypothetical protein
MYDPEASSSAAAAAPNSSTSTNDAANSSTSTSTSTSTDDAAAAAAPRARGKAAPKAAPKICKATTTRGAPCKRHVTVGDYCCKHSGSLPAPGPGQQFLCGYKNCCAVTAVQGEHCARCKVRAEAPVEVAPHSTDDQC